MKFNLIDIDKKAVSTAGPGGWIVPYAGYIRASNFSCAIDTLGNFNARVSDEDGAWKVFNGILDHIQKRNGNPFLFTAVPHKQQPLIDLLEICPYVHLIGSVKSRHTGNYPVNLYVAGRLFNTPKR